MKKVNAIITKLEKVPSAVWILLVGVSYVFANLYSLITTSDQMIASLNEYMAQMAVEFTGFVNNLAWVFYLETGLIGIILFELILMLVYRFLYNRRYVNNNMLHFKTVARVLYILANTVFGLISLISFAAPAFELYNLYIIGFLVFTGAYLVIYLVLTESVVHPKYKGTAFMKLFSFYFLLEGLLNLVYFVVFLTAEDFDLHEKIASGVSLGVIALTAVLIYRFIAKPLLKQEKERIEIIPPEDTPSPPNEIFRGYGF